MGSAACRCSVSPTRVRGFQGRYYEKRLVFAIHPDPLSEDLTASQQEARAEGGEEDVPRAFNAIFLMEALAKLTDQMIQDNEVFAEITGANAGGRFSETMGVHGREKKSIDCFDDAGYHEALKV